MSRRQADRYILEGRIRVNGRRVTELGLQVDVEKDEVSLDGSRVCREGRRVYVLLNKPAGYLVSSSDPHGRQTVYDLLQDLPGRVFSVGRLDRDTEGVLLFTDDGELANRLAHPRYQIIKGYRARVRGRIEPQRLEKLVKGVRLEDGMATARVAKVLSRGPDDSEIYIELTTGKKRQVKRMCAAIGHPVIHLSRTTFAGLNAEGLPCGQWRHLTGQEVRMLKSAPG